MSKKQQQPKKLYQPTFRYAIAIIALNLFILGLISSVVYLSEKTVKNLKESIEIELILNDTLSANDIDKVATVLKNKDYILRTTYRSKEDAATLYAKQIGQEFTDILGYNPLYNAYIINIKAEHTAPEALMAIKSDLFAVSGIKEVLYPEPIIGMFGDTFKSILIGIAILSVILLILTIFIIDITIRLMLYSQRNSVKTMQLIGATDWFITKPYIKRAALSGLLSVIIAIIINTLIILVAVNKFGIIIEQIDVIYLGAIALILTAIGLVISIFSTYFAVRKYLHFKLDDLY